MSKELIELREEYIRLQHMINEAYGNEVSRPLKCKHSGKTGYLLWQRLREVGLLIRDLEFPSTVPTYRQRDASSRGEG